MRADKHPRENERLAALFACEILDTEREAEFDDIVKVAAAVCGTPASTITFVDSDRQWFKAATGMPPEAAPLELAICAHTLLSDELVEIPDTQLDARTKDNPHCGEGGCRFYAGVQLVGPRGLPLGTLCVLGFAPQKLTETQRYTLQVLAHHVVKLLELRKERIVSDILRHEVDHRVKNSLASLLAIIRLEQRTNASTAAGHALEMVSRHIEVTAAVHEAMYHPKSNGGMSLKSLLEHLGALIQNTLPANIALQLDIEDAQIPDAAASKIAIIVNEIITNATKHAFPDGRAGQISFVGRAGPSGDYVLSAHDDGLGDAAATVRPSSGIGQRIMNGAAAQISGRLVQDTAAPGMGWQLTFPLS